jgi:hypothetical protein
MVVVNRVASHGGFKVLGHFGDRRARRVGKLSCALARAISVPIAA